MDPFREMDRMARRMQAQMDEMDRFMGRSMGSAFSDMPLARIGTGFGRDESVYHDDHVRGSGIGRHFNLHDGFGSEEIALHSGEPESHYGPGAGRRHGRSQGGRHVSSFSTTSSAFGGGGGGGTWRVESRTQSRVVRPDGTEERFEQSHIGGSVKGSPHVHETHQLYSDSSTGEEKVSIERGLGDRARKIVKERVQRGERSGGEAFLERSHDLMKGMLKDDGPQFHDDWLRHAERLTGNRRAGGHGIADAEREVDRSRTRIERDWDSRPSDNARRLSHRVRSSGVTESAGADRRLGSRIKHNQRMKRAAVPALSDRAHSHRSGIEELD